MMRTSNGRSPRRLSPELALRVALLKEQRARERRNRRRTRPFTDRERLAIAMVQSRCTYQAIGDALGVVRDRARQIVRRIRRDYGEGVFIAPEQQFWTIAEAAQELGVPPGTIHRRCKRGGISCIWRGAEGTQYLITDDGMEQLRTEPRATRTRACAMCGTPFTVVSGQSWRRSMCGSLACRREQRRGYRQEVLANAPTEESITGWGRAVFRALQRHRPTGGTEWITIGEAVRRTGLSDMQMRWLQLRRVLTVRPHPTKKWCGRPVATLAASEVAIVRKVYAAHQKRRARA